MVALLLLLLLFREVVETASKGVVVLFAETGGTKSSALAGVGADSYDDVMANKKAFFVECELIVLQESFCLKNGDKAERRQCLCSVR